MCITNYLNYWWVFDHFRHGELSNENPPASELAGWVNTPWMFEEFSGDGINVSELYHP